MARLFFALWPEAATAQTLAAFAGECRAACGGRAMRAETLHLTLAFLGETSPERAALARRVADGVVAAPFELCIDRLGYWRHNRILWAGCESPPLTALAERLGAGLRGAGFALEARPFAAHLTLLRDARCADLPAPSAPLAWPVREFLLVESRPAAAGPHYAPVGRWPLAG